ncbi:hypothetical protein CO104_01575 [Candidatus Collierbacteria bacterium CG_4_9_14_3_um_filter_43_16]|uniref:Uncharacterized protein n=1 Tax=Candidatus Collierbacteria bacterium CG_4_9_14_3_um_filter_43_16 TaxID=1974532 RepID=A0A2M8BWU3_9BACT|nr:MAG: hypothetical protein CO104_01575 [Candidatus Collierbacteria bacterium CG_4_9_14_3_um_filter_43_16]
MSNFNVLARPSASLAPARRPHPPRLRNCRLVKVAESGTKKNAKILKNFLTQMAALVVLNSDCSKLSKAAIKKAIRTS